jgi:hypothetical protein
MAECLKIYSYVTGVDDPYFHDAENPILITEFTYTANRMGSVQLTASFYHKDQLDDYWDGKQYVLFRGEKYFVKQVPSSTKDTSSDRYKYDVTFKSERSILDDVYFFDVVTDETESDRYQSNNTNVVFFGDVHEFAKRLNYSLQYSGLDYSVVVDDDVTSESKYLQFEDKFISDVLQEIYDTYDVPYYFDGKVIHIGYTNNVVAIPFAYGASRELLYVSKTNANYRIVNRCSGVGSSDNIPFYYPNKTEKGDITAVCPKENTGVTSDMVHVRNMRQLAALSLSDKLIYDSVSEYANISEVQMTDSTTGDEFKNGTLIQGDLVIEGVGISQWVVKAHEVIIKFSINIQSSGTAYVSLNTKYKLPVASIQSSGDVPLLVNMGAVEELSLSTDGGASYTSIDKTFQIIESGEYYLKLNTTFKGVDTRPISVSGYSMDIELSGSATISDWTLNGTTKVSLSQYGIYLDADAIPQNRDVIYIESQGDIIRTTGTLMPSIYRETRGAERFYNALNDTYPDGDGGYLHFDNEYTDTDPKEQIVDFSDIKPTIVGITNADGVRIDQIADIAFDDDDNDDVDDDGEYLHPYFYVKLHKFDGEFGFNLFDMAIVGDSNMTLSLTSGNCSAASFEIVSVETDDGRFLNPVQVDGSGNIVPGGVSEKVNTSNIQTSQQDTSENSVWIALRKDDSTFGVVIPNVGNNYKPSAGDSFVLLYIDLPEAYQLAAEKRLDDAILEYMLENNNSKFNFSLQFSRIFFAENPDILAQVNENARIILEYNNKEYTLYITTYTYTVSEDEDLPDVSVDLKDTITVVKGTIEQMVDSAVGDTVVSMGLGEPQDVLAVNTRYFLRKDTQDVARKRITFMQGATFGNFADILGGAMMDIDPVTGQSTLTVDKLKVRLKAYFNELTVMQANSIGGKHIITPAGSIVCTNVEDTSDGTAYRCYFNTSQDGRRIVNMFVVGDLALSQSFNVMAESNQHGVTSNYYWREVVGVGTDYIDISKTLCDPDSDAPKAGDVICHLGNVSDASRQGAIVLSAVDNDSPSVTLYSGISTYSYAGKDQIRFGINGSTNEPFLAVYGSMFFGDRDLSDPDATFITFQQKEGEDRKRIHIKADITFGAGSDGLSNLSEWQSLTDSVSDAQTAADNANTKAESAQSTANDANTKADDAMSAASNAESTANDALAAAEEAAKKAQDAKDYIDSTLPDEIANINKKLDGVVENWFYPYSPTIENKPAASWILNGEEAKHEGDTFTNTEPYVDDETTPDSGKSWRWVKSEDGSYRWTVIADSDAVKALQEAAKAQDTADSKRRIFVVQPTTPYEVGDMWAQGDGGDLLRCIKSRSSGSFEASDWDLASKYTDDTVANEVNNRLDGWASDGVISPPEKSGLEQIYQSILYEKDTIIARAAKYGISTDAYESAFVLAVEALIKYTSTEQETIPVEEDYGNISAYYSAREELLRQINDAEETAISDLNYLKQVFPNAVVDNNGVFLSQLMAVKSGTGEDAEVVAGLYGGGVEALNNAGFMDAEHGVLMFFAGAENVQSVSSAKTRIYGDGHIVTNDIEANGGIFGIFNIGEDDNGRPAIKYSYTADDGYIFDNRITAEVMLLNGHNADRTDEDIVAISPVASPDIYDFDGVVNVYSKRRPLLVLSQEGGEVSIRNNNGGTFEGLHYPVRTIASSYTLDLYDHILIIAAGVAKTSITIPANPHTGKEYMLYKMSVGVIRLNSPYNPILTPNVMSSLTSLDVGDNEYGVIKLTFDGSSWIVFYFKATY